MEDGVQYQGTDLPLTENEIAGPQRSDDPSDVEELRDAIAAISAAKARALRAVARCARQGAFRKRGFRSMTDWLSTEFPIGLGIAKEWVFLSRKLAEIPRIAAAHERGRLTSEQLTPLARFATPETDEHWAEAAPRMYPAQLWRENERRTRPRIKDERAAHASRYLSLVWDKDDPVLDLQGRLGKEQGSALEEAIAKRSREIPVDPDADDPAEARRADALVELATSSGEGAGAPKPHLVVHTDIAVLNRTAPRTGPRRAETERGRCLHPETIRRLGCDADVERVWERDGLTVGIDRKSARVPGWLERAVRHRDAEMCRFPGCERRISLLSHHIKHWGDGGTTDLDNLVTLCGTHHRYVHEDGWRIGGDPGGELRFHDPTGRPAPRASPTVPAA